MALTQISPEEWEAIERQTAKTLPNRPSAAGLSAETIRDRLYKALTSDTHSFKAIIIGLINDINAEIDSLPLSAYETDAVTQVVDYTLVDNTEKTFSAENTSMAITIPATAGQGFHAGVNFKTGSSPDAVAFTNNSALTLKILRYREVEIPNYIPGANTAVTMLIYSDGLYIYCHISEVA